MFKIYEENLQKSLFMHKLNIFKCESDLEEFENVGVVTPRICTPVFFSFLYYIFPYFLKSWCMFADLFFSYLICNMTFATVRTDGRRRMLVYDII